MPDESVQPPLTSAAPAATGLTMGELWSRRERMEAEAASLLGRMLFELSYIDVNLGLALTCVNDGKNLEAPSKKVASLSLNDKLEKLEKEVAAKLPFGSKCRKALDAWIARMHKARAQRNEMVHGRWGFEPQKNVVVNVIGLPSGDQNVVEYTVAQLAAVHEDLRSLNRELQRLRGQLDDQSLRVGLR